jgi:hypothetical protein
MKLALMHGMENIKNRELNYCLHYYQLAKGNYVVNLLKPGGYFIYITTNNSAA